MNKAKSKTPSMSTIFMREMVMPQHTNPQGTIFGGTVMSWVDVAAAMSAAKHAMKPVVTAHIDSLSFLESISVGDHVILTASVNYVNKTSMLVGVKVEKENPLTGERKTTTRAYLTFVALDDKKRPTKVPSLKPETEDEIRRYKNAKKRMELAKKLREKIKTKG